MILEKRLFRDIDLDDVFFDSLKKSYAEFSDWYIRKAATNSWAYTSYDNGSLSGFLYVKTEDEAVLDVEPALPRAKRLKIGTFKIDARGTKMGERFVKKIFDHAVHENVHEVYVTIFSEHTPLIKILQKYGFVHCGVKNTHNGVEQVYLKTLSFSPSKDIVQNFPLINNASGNSHLLSIYPQWHTRLLPDSILRNENGEDLIEDISHTNSIHKVYLCGMDGVAGMRPGDRVLIYRPGESDPKWFKSVATSICVVEEYRNMRSFKDENQFLEYCLPYSVFEEDELRGFWAEKRFTHIIRFMYNSAFTRRLTMQALVENFGLNRTEYWGHRVLPNEQLARIAAAGGVHESLIVN